MTRPTTVEVRTHRGHRLEVRDDGGEGWIVAVHPPRGGAPPEVLRNGVPNGLAALLAEARRRVDRRLDGAPDGAAPRGA
jgi:hypothetical protein